MKQLFLRINSFFKKSTPAELAVSLVELTIVLALIVVIGLTAARLMWDAMQKNSELTVAHHIKSILTTSEEKPIIASNNSAGEVEQLSTAEIISAYDNFLVANHNNSKALGQPIAMSAAALFVERQSEDIDGEIVTSCVPPDPADVVCRYIDANGAIRNCTTEEIEELIEECFTAGDCQSVKATTIGFIGDTTCYWTDGGETDLLQIEYREPPNGGYAG